MTVQGRRFPPLEEGLCRGRAIHLPTISPAMWHKQPHLPRPNTPLTLQPRTRWHTATDTLPLGFRTTGKSPKGSPSMPVFAMTSTRNRSKIKTVSSGSPPTFLGSFFTPQPSLLLPRVSEVVYPLTVESTSQAPRRSLPLRREWGLLTAPLPTAKPSFAQGTESSTIRSRP